MILSCIRCLLFSFKAIHGDSWKLASFGDRFCTFGQYFLGQKIAPILDVNTEEKKIKSITVMIRALLYQNGSIPLT